MSAASSHPWIAVESDNLTGLTELNEETLLQSVRKRYLDNLIYTNVGDILVAVNPFRQLPIYDQEWSQAFVHPDVSGLSPHVFHVAARAFNAMVQGKRDQVCVISGESGAGKTESAKFIMRQVMDMCKSTGLGQQLQDKIIQLNPLLEAFGNASTALNDNSSRFGKYIQLVFQPGGRIVGAGLEQYLLEKSRVCVQGEQERNFHIFYYMYAGLSPEMLKQLKLKSPQQHRYLQSYNYLEEDCSSSESKTAFDVVLDSMKSIGFTEKELEHTLVILAAILLIGEIEFAGADGGEDSARVSNPEAVKVVSEVLQLESSDELSFALTTLRTTTRGEHVDKVYSCSKAADIRDATAKALYARMFQWMVSRLNSYLQPPNRAEHLHIGILDIFGFENFEQNSFEQLCINLANEQLQQYFNHQIFAMEKMEYAKEGLDGLVISYKDNKPVLDLFLTRPIGLLSLLDEQCRGLNGTEKAFVQRCKDSLGKHSSYLPHKGDALVFTIKHYAGDVEYRGEGFLEKNKDSLPDTVVETLRFSELRLVKTLFTRMPSASSTSQLKKSVLMKSQRSVMRAMSRRRRPSMRRQKPGAANKKISTVSAHFRQSLDLLMERVFAASPHFVRCIKPNMEKRPSSFDGDFVVKQLRYTGMLEAVRVRREGFAYRPFFCDFCQTYRSLAFYFTDKSVKPRELACREILDKAGITGWMIGKSRVFLRYFHQDKLQLLLKEMEDKAILIQRVYRGYSTRKWARPLQETQRREKALVVEFLSTMNQHGQESLPKLLALNKVDILLAVKRFGNRRRDAESASNGDEDEGGSEQEKRKKRAKKAGILVPVFGEAFASQNGDSALELARKRPKSNVLAAGGKSRGDRTSRGSVGKPESSDESETRTSRYSSGGEVPQTPPESPITDKAHHSPKHGRHLVGGVRLLPELNALSESHLKHVKPTREESRDEQLPQATQVHDGLVKGSNKSREVHSHWRSSGDIMSPSRSSQGSTPEHSSEADSPRRGKRPVGQVRQLLLIRPSPQHHQTIPDSPTLTSEHLHTHQVAPIPSSPSSASTDSSPAHPTSSGTAPTPERKPKLQNGVHRPEAESGAGRRVPLKTQESGEISLDFMSDHSGPVRNGNLFTVNSSSVPNLLDDDPPLWHTDLLSNKLLSPKHAQISRSTEHLLEDYSGRGRYSSSNGSPIAEEVKGKKKSGASKPSSHGMGQPQSPAEKKQNGKGWFSFGRRKKDRKFSKNSIGSSDETPMSPPPMLRRESSSETLGLYPDLTHQAAMEMVSGQPRGTYVLFRGDSRIYSDHPQQFPVYQLVVSGGGGREVHTFFIQSSANGWVFVNSLDSHISFPALRTLLEYYKKMELSKKLYLLQPRLVAGVSVTGVRLVKKPASPKGRFGRRRRS